MINKITHLAVIRFCVGHFQSQEFFFRQLVAHSRPRYLFGPGYTVPAVTRTARYYKSKTGRAFVPLFVHGAAHFDRNYGRPYADVRACREIIEIGTKARFFTIVSFYHHLTNIFEKLKMKLLTYLK